MAKSNRYPARTCVRMSPCTSDVTLQSQPDHSRPHRPRRHGRLCQAQCPAHARAQPCLPFTWILARPGLTSLPFLGKSFILVCTCGRTFFPARRLHDTPALKDVCLLDSTLVLSQLSSELRVRSFPLLAVALPSALATATLSLALLFGAGSMPVPANAVSGGVADFVNIAGQDLSGKKVCVYVRECTYHQCSLV